MRCPMSSNCGNEEGIPRHSRSGHWRHGQSRQRYYRRYWRARHGFAIRQRARARNGASVGIEDRSCLKSIVVTPEFPHALREVRIKVAVENCIADDLISVSRSDVRDLRRECEARSYCLTIEV